MLATQLLEQIAVLNQFKDFPNEIVKFETLAKQLKQDEKATQEFLHFIATTEQFVDKLKNRFTYLYRCKELDKINAQQQTIIYEKYKPIIEDISHYYIAKLKRYKTLTPEQKFNFYGSDDTVNIMINQLKECLISDKNEQKYEENNISCLQEKLHEFIKDFKTSDGYEINFEIELILEDALNEINKQCKLFNDPLDQVITKFYSDFKKSTLCGKYADTLIKSHEKLQTELKKLSTDPIKNKSKIDKLTAEPPEHKTLASYEAKLSPKEKDLMASFPNFYDTSGADRLAILLPEQSFNHFLEQCATALGVIAKNSQSYSFKTPWVSSFHLKR